jgi:hypothetical protein
MKQFQLKTLLCAIAVLSVLSACRKDKQVVVTPEIPPAERAGIYVLNEGNFMGNNSSLTYYDYTTKVTTPDIFKTANGGSGLGDTGNDIQIYGSKMYILVNVSSTIEIVNPKTAKSIKQIKMVDGTIDRQPRNIVFYKNKAFISSFDGTVAVLDTASLAIEKFITVGRNPEQMAISNNKLYVANSGGLGATFDNTVSVIDLSVLPDVTNLVEAKKITVSSNPITMAADAYGDVYVIAYGAYLSTPKFSIINSATDVVKSTTDIDAGYSTPFLINGDVAYLFSNAGKVKVYNVKTDSNVNENFITDGTIIAAPYALAVDSTTGEVFIADAIDYSSNGTLFAFDKNGKKEYSITTGISPGAIVFVNK